LKNINMWPPVLQSTRRIPKKTCQHLFTTLMLKSEEVSAKFRFNLFREKNKCGRDIINYDIIKLPMLRSQIRDFRSYGFRGILFSWKNFLFEFFFAKNAKFREKVCKKRTKIFVFFHKSFCSLETLGGLHLSVNYKSFFKRLYYYRIKIPEQKGLGGLHLSVNYKKVSWKPNAMDPLIQVYFIFIYKKL